MEKEEQDRDSFEKIEYLLRDIQIPPDFGGTDRSKTKKSQSLADYFWVYSGLKDWSGEHRFECLFNKGKQTSDSERIREAVTVFFWHMECPPKRYPFEVLDWN